MTTTTELAAPTIAFTAGGAIATDRGATFPAVTVDRSGPDQLMVTIYDPTNCHDDTDQGAVIEFGLDHEHAMQLASALRGSTTTGHRLDAVTCLGERVRLVLDVTPSLVDLTTAVDGRATTIHGLSIEAMTLARALSAVANHHTQPAASAEVWPTR